jgi:allantoin racemase
MTTRQKKAAGGSDKHVVYQLVAPMERSLGPEEIEHRRAFLQSYAVPGTTVEVRSIKRGVAAIESAYDAAMAVPYILESLREPPCGPGVAVIIGCFSDPGLDAAREIIAGPVVGPAMSAMHLAMQLGNRFSIIAPSENGSGHSASYVRMLGLDSSYASTRGMGLSVIELAKGNASAFDRIAEVGRRCVQEDRADVLILGCMSMAFLGLTAELEDRIGVPVVSPVIAALKTAEMMLSHAVTHSRIGWPAPPPKAVLDRNS